MKKYMFGIIWAMMRKTKMRERTNVTMKPNNVRRASLCAVSRGMWSSGSITVFGFCKLCAVGFATSMNGFWVSRQFASKRVIDLALVWLFGVFFGGKREK